jgi:RimJ/RimL family protein N-acetyltransferase
MTVVVDEDQIGPRAVGRSTSVWQRQPSDFDVLHSLVSDEVVRASWRTRGLICTRDQLEHALTDEVLLSAVIRSGHGQTDPIVGLIEVLEFVAIDRRAQLALVVDRAHLGTAVGVDAVAALVPVLFDQLPIDKLQMETLATNRRVVRGLRRLLTHEGRFQRHVNVLGEMHDIEVFALWRDDLPRLRARLTPLETVSATA